MGAASLILWLSLLNQDEKQLGFLPQPTFEELILATMSVFPDAATASFSFATADGEPVTEHNVASLKNETEVVATPSFAHQEYTVLSNRPRIFHFPHFITDAEADAMIKLGEGFMKQSEVGDGSADGNQETSIRSSKVYFLAHEQEDHWAPRSIKRKVQQHTKFPYEFMEALQVQKYRAPRNVGGRTQFDFYVPHLDSIGGPDRRIATMLLYLEDTPEGGETVFPLVRPNVTGRPGFELDPQEAMSASQSVFEAACRAKTVEDMSVPVIKVPARKGSAVLFYTLQPGMQLDPLAVHGSCPVTKGIKWVSQQWIRESWQEPLYSSHLEAFWTMEDGAHRGGQQGGVVGSDSEAGTLALPGSITDSSTFKAGTARHHLFLRGAAGSEDSGEAAEWARPQDVVKAGDSLRWCTRPDANLLRHVKQSKSLTLAFWVKLDDDASGSRVGGSIRLRTTGDAGNSNCCEWNIGMDAGGADGDYASITGPARGGGSDEAESEGVRIELEQGQWNQLALTVEDGDATEVDFARRRKRWSQSSCLVQSVPSRMNGAVDADCIEADVAIEDVNWHSAELCVDKPPGVMFSDMFLFTRDLQPEELSHLGNTVYANKPVREEIKKLQKWRLGVGPY